MAPRSRHLPSLLHALDELGERDALFLPHIFADSQFDTALYPQLSELDAR